MINEELNKSPNHYKENDLNLIANNKLSNSFDNDYHPCFSAKMKEGDFTNDIYSYIHHIKNASEEILLFVVHGIGQNERKITSSLNKIKDMVNQLYKKNKLFLTKQIHIRMIDWKRNINVGDLQKLMDSNNNTKYPKQFIQGVPTDFIYYMGVNKYSLLNDVIFQMNSYIKLLKKHRPLFYGSISTIGHSLGSLILYDIFRNMQYEDNNEKNNVTVLNEEIVKEIDNDLSRRKSSFNMAESSDENESHNDKSNQEKHEQDSISNKKVVNIVEEEINSLKNLITFNVDNIIFKDKNSFIETFESNSSNSQNNREVKKAKEIHRKSLLLFENNVFKELFHKKIISLHDKINEVHFNVDHFFMIGSPLGLIQSIEYGENCKLESMPIVKDFHNIIHPMDPVAYRIEPLIKNYPYLDNSFLLPHWENDGIRKPFFRSIMKVLCLDTDTNYEYNNHDNRIGKKRYDFMIQESPIESAFHIIGFLFSHQAYWKSQDVFYFILKMSHWQGYIGLNSE